jgi:hypothetical protein
LEKQMTDNVFLNADRSEVVDQFGPGKKWQVPRKEAVRLGLLKDEAKPAQQRRNADDADVAVRSTTTTPRADRQRRRSTKK